MLVLKIQKIIVFLILFICCSSCSVFRSLRYGGIPSQTDYKHFPQRIVANEGPLYHFYKANKELYLGTKIGLIQ